MIREIDVRELAAAHRRGALVLDVREPGEYVAGHVPGAKLMSLRQVAGRLDELPRGERIYVICASGNRSRGVADRLAGIGLEAYSVRGGTSAWQAAGYPLVRGPRENAA